MTRHAALPTLNHIGISVGTETFMTEERGPLRRMKRGPVPGLDYFAEKAVPAAGSNSPMPEGADEHALAMKPRRNGWGQGGSEISHESVGAAGAVVRPRTTLRAESKTAGAVSCMMEASK
ncbi:MAG: hypothetical protein AAGD43_02560 [Pseudomonadota bacterium]